MANTYFTGDTIRVIVTFRDWAPVGTSGAIVDPTSVVVNTYNADGSALVLALTAVKESAGIYHYDWTLPATDGKYIIEFIGTSNSEPTVIRSEVQVKFKPLGLS